MRFVLTDTQGQALQTEEAMAFELNQSIDTPCDSLYVELPLQTLGEIETVEAWQRQNLIFKGPVDLQSGEIEAGSDRIVLWARNQAAYLVDNECMPCAYHMPTADTLFLRYGAPYGLTNRLPPLLLEQTLDITKGTSCWHALDTLVKNVCGQQIYVNSQGELRIFTPTEQMHRFTEQAGGGLPYTAVAVRRKRSAPVTTVIYKTETNGNYSHRAEQTDLIPLHLEKTRCLNLTALAPRQRGGAVTRLLTDSRRHYFTIRLTFEGFPAIRLYDRAVFDHSRLGHYENLLVTELCSRSDSRGQRCTVTLSPAPVNTIAFYKD